MAINGKGLGMPNSPTDENATASGAVAADLLDHNTTEQRFQDALYNVLLQVDQSEVDLGYTPAEGEERDAPVKERLDLIEGGSYTPFSMTSDLEGNLSQANLRAGAVDTAAIADDAVTTDKILADAIDESRIADDAVRSEHIMDGQVLRAALEADAIDDTRIADDAVRTEHIMDSEVTNAKLANDSVMVHGSEFVLGAADADIRTVSRTLSGVVPATGPEVTNERRVLVDDITWDALEDWAFVDSTTLIPSSRVSSAFSTHNLRIQNSVANSVTVQAFIGAAVNRNFGLENGDIIIVSDERATPISVTTWTYTGVAVSATVDAQGTFVQLGQVQAYTAAADGGLEVNANEFSISDGGVGNDEVAENSLDLDRLQQIRGRRLLGSHLVDSGAEDRDIIELRVDTAQELLEIQNVPNEDWTTAGTGGSSRIHAGRLPSTIPTGNLPSGISATTIGNGNVDNTELSLLNGLTSLENVQTAVPTGAVFTDTTVSFNQTGTATDDQLSTVRVNDDNTIVFSGAGGSRTFTAANNIVRFNQSGTTVDDNLASIAFMTNTDGDPILRFSNGTSTRDFAGGGGASVEVSSTPPTNPSEGDIWYDCDGGRLYVYYTDANSSQWVDASPAGSEGTPGIATVSGTAPADPGLGTMWYDNGTARLYIWNGSAWIDASPAALAPEGEGGGGAQFELQVSGRSGAGGMVFTTAAQSIDFGSTTALLSAGSWTMSGQNNFGGGNYVVEVSFNNGASYESLGSVGTANSFVSRSSSAISNRSVTLPSGPSNVIVRARLTRGGDNFVGSTPSLSAFSITITPVTRFTF